MSHDLDQTLELVLTSCVIRDDIESHRSRAMQSRSISSVAVKPAHRQRLPLALMQGSDGAAVNHTDRYDDAFHYPTANNGFRFGSKYSGER